MTQQISLNEDKLNIANFVMDRLCMLFAHFSQNEMLVTYCRVVVY